MNINAKYITIDWLDKNTIVSIKEEKFLESIEIKSDNLLFLEIYTYPKIDNLHAQIAFSIDDDNCEPAIYINQEQSYKLKSIVDPETQKKWWIENGKWKIVKQIDENGNHITRKYYESQFFNHIGNSLIKFNDIKLEISILEHTLNKEAVNRILSLFKNELWKMIYDAGSYSTLDIDNKKSNFSQEYVKLLDSYLYDTNILLNNLKCVLSDNYSKKHIRKIIPTKKTFQEYITNSSARYYTSINKIEDYNIAENKYIYYTFKIVQFLFNSNIEYNNYMKKSIKTKMEDYDKDLSKLKTILSTKKLEVNKNSYLKELEMLKKNRDTFKYNIIFNGDDNKDNVKEYYIHIYNIGYYNNQKYYDSYIWQLEDKKEKRITKRIYCNKFDEIINHKGVYLIKCNIKMRDEYVTFINFEAADDSSIKQNNSYKTHSFCNFKKVENKYKKGYSKYQCLSSYKLKDNKIKNIIFYLDVPNDSNYNKSIKKLIDNKELYKKIEILTNTNEQKITFPVEITKIVSIDPTSLIEKIQKYEAKRNIYNANNWIRDLNTNNKEDKELLENIKQQIEILEKFKLDEEALLNNQLKENDIKQIRNKMNHLEKIFIEYKITPSEVFPTSMVFIQNHMYTSVNLLFNKLLNMQNIDISSFKNIESLNSITVTNIPKIYERSCLIIILNILIETFKFLPVENNYINKLVNEVTSNPRNIEIKLYNKKLNEYITIWYEKELESKKRPDIILELEQYGFKIIIDAKFHEEAHIKNLIKELYLNKNYSEGKKNPVFIIHPDINALQRNGIYVYSNNLINYSYFGEDNLFYNDLDKANIDDSLQKKDNHKYGAICFNPNNYTYLTEMQKFLAMCLQYYPYTLQGSTSEYSLCANCGEINQLIDNNKGVGKHTKCSCGHFCVYTHCFECKSKIIKNGYTLTYHKILPDDPFNVFCSYCGEHLVIMR